MEKMIHVTVWNEFCHEKSNPEIAKIYPKGMHEAIASYLRSQPGFEVRTATLDEPDHGLTDEVLASTDVLTWWGHKAHKEVRDDIVDKVQSRVLEGMGLIVLHSAHYSKIFRKLMGTRCDFGPFPAGLNSIRIQEWSDFGEKEILWSVDPFHPITEGLGEYIIIENTELYCERFQIPRPDELVFISWFEGYGVFRSGCCFYRDKGRIFYFRPGHENYPIYYHPDVLKIISNAVRWAALPDRLKA